MKLRVALMIAVVVALALGGIGWAVAAVRAGQRTVGVTYTDSLELVTIPDQGARKGTVTVEVSEVQELINILSALSDTGSYFKDDAYYKEVVAFFGPQRTHPAVAAVQAYIQQRAESMIRRCVIYKFDDSDRLVPALYLNQDQWMPNFCATQGALLEDFARQSDFRRFFRDHAAFYAAMVKDYQERVNPQAMWRWLEQQFPLRVDSLRVELSRISGGTHNAARYRDTQTKYTEAVHFVSDTSVWDSREPDRAVAGALTGGNLFTEIDHNYINPLTDQHAQEIARAMGDYRKWNAGRGYASAGQTFNEYMTWGVFSLYAEEQLDAATYAGLMKWHRLQMVNSRGFVKYDKFQQGLVELYRNRKSGETLADLYPQIIRMTVVAGR